MLAPEVEQRPWTEQFSHDAVHYKIQISYLLAHSEFYRTKFKAAGFASAEAADSLRSVAQLPFTEKNEIRASCTAENPIGTHLCVGRADIVRIYSTSGTTGTPSYIPLTASDLDRWTTDNDRPGLVAARRADVGVAVRRDGRHRERHPDSGAGAKRAWCRRLTPATPHCLPDSASRRARRCRRVRCARVHAFSERKNPLRVVDNGIVDELPVELDRR